MNRRHLLLRAGVLACACTAETAWTQSRGPYRTMQWEDLLPDGWDPRAALAGLNPSRIPEGSPQELELQRKMRKIWDSAPVRPELEGRRARLAGYVVPLEYTTGAIREFLLVPYFGACIHSPPPPANQIVMVIMQQAVRIKTMDACWVSGILGLQTSDTAWGVSGYTLQGHQIDEYRGPRKP